MASDWPAFDVERDSPTLALLHLASQMLGKIRVAHAPWMNHGWHVALQPRPSGFETLPTASGDGRTFTLRLDLCHHAIVLWASDETRDQIPLDLGSIAAIHGALVGLLARHGLPSNFNGAPSEVVDAIPFKDDHAPRSYSRETADRLRQAFAVILPVFERFRAGFIGKASPVHLWWGAFDLAVTRFSGRLAPEHPGGIPGLPDRITREAYSHEVSSAGFWPGGVTAADPIFYCYAYPEPAGFRAAEVAPESAGFDEALGEFVLPYEAVRRADRPDAELMAFLESTYAAAANLARWNRAEMEREPVAP